MLDGKSDEVYLAVYGSFAGVVDGKTFESGKLLGVYGIEKMKRDDVWKVDQTVTMDLPIVAKSAALAVQLFEHDKRGKLYDRLTESVGEGASPVEDERTFRLPGGKLPKDRASWVALAVGVLTRLIKHIRNDDELGTFQVEADMDGVEFDDDDVRFSRFGASYYLDVTAKVVTERTT